MNLPGPIVSSHYIAVLALTMALAVFSCSAEEPADRAAQANDENISASASESDPIAETAATPELKTGGDDASSQEQPPQKLAALTEGAGEPESEEIPSRFKQGEHYQLLTPTQPTSSSPDKVEVAEVFWYGCGHCYSFEPFVANWLERKEPNVEFVRIPVMWGAIHRIHARAFYTADALGVLEDVHGDLFREINVNKNRLHTQDALKDFFASHGVDREDFDKAFRSFSVETKLKRADTLMRRYGADSTPLIVVNGKYTADGISAQGFENLVVLIDELVAKETSR